MQRSLIAGAVALALILATGSALARISGPLGFPFGFDLVALARSQLGNGAIYGRHTRWCARFVNWLLEHAGYHGTGSDAARSFLHLPRVTPQVGAIAVLYRKGGGHVGIVSGFDRRGNPVLISGNHGRRGVWESIYPRSRVVAYVAPAESAAVARVSGLDLDLRSDLRSDLGDAVSFENKPLPRSKKQPSLLGERGKPGADSNGQLGGPVD